MDIEYCPQFPGSRRHSPMACAMVVKFAMIDWQAISAEGNWERRMYRILLLSICVVLITLGPTRHAQADCLDKIKSIEKQLGNMGGLGIRRVEAVDRVLRKARMAHKNGKRRLCRKRVARAKEMLVDQ